MSMEEETWPPLFQCFQSKLTVVGKMDKSTTGLFLFSQIIGENWGGNDEATYKTPKTDFEKYIT